MKGYTAYKDSDVDWFGEIPVNWEVMRLKHLVAIPLKYGANESGTSEEKDNIRYLRITDFDDAGNLRDGDKKYLATYTASEYMLEEGDVLFARSGATVGKTFQFKNSDVRACFAGYLIQAKPNKDRLCSDFLNFFTKSGGYLNWKNSIFIQATIQNIGADKYNNLFVPTPPLPEQEAIASYLDRKTKLIDELITKKERLIVLKKEERAAIINQAVTKGLDPVVPMKDSGIEWLGKIPEHWQVKKLKYITTKIGDGIHTTPQYTDESEYHFINGNNLINGEIRIFENTRKVDYGEYTKYYQDLQEESILISINGTIGNLAFYRNEKVILGKSAAYMECSSIVENTYLYHSLATDYINTYFEKSFSGTTIKNLSLYTLQNTAISFPPLIEQRKIADFVTQKNSYYTSIENKLRRQIDLLKEYKTTLISEAVTGKIKIPLNTSSYNRS